MRLNDEGSAMTTAAKRRTYAGPPLLSFGFRPFFLLTSAWTALIVPMWVLAHLGFAPFAGLLTRDWHVHEMLFGYLGGVMAGFLLTAIPNWTGRLPVMGAPLAGLVGLWMAGRVAMLVSPTSIGAAVVDAAFLVVFAGVVWREVRAGRSWKNLPVCALVTLFALANVSLHLRPVAPDLATGAERAALGVAAVMIALIGGRVTPSFTRNWLVQRRETSLPAQASHFDLATLIITAMAVTGWVALPASPATGATLMLAGAGGLCRLGRWRGELTLAEPLVWILHNGYGWLGLALLLMGASVLWPAEVPASAGIHALTVGAIGVMTLAMMTRAILGHTGRARTAGRGTLAIYLFTNFAACLRVSAAFLPAHQTSLLACSAAAWSIAFGGFVLVYGPMLVGTRADLTLTKVAAPAPTPRC
jgi:uncharacterized protein involved in response to NO